MAASMNGGAAVAECLRRAGITQVFGLLGGSMLELYDALHGSEVIRYIGARDERAATHMADAYARITRTPGVVLAAQSGPGAANLVTGLAEAKLAYSPLVAIAGMTTRDHQGRDTFQEIDQQALFTPVSKRCFTVPTAERLPEFLEEALRLAMSGRRGPVVLNVPRDLMAAEIEPDLAAGPVQVAEAGGPSAEQLERLLDKLARAKAPVVLAGGGIKWSDGGAALARLAETLRVPIAASVGHGDVMPADHPFFAGQVGPRGNRVASGLTRDADLVIALGTRLGFNSTFHSHDYVTKTGEIVQIDVEPAAVGRHFPVALGIVADARATAEALADGAQARGLDGAAWQAWTARFQADRRELRAERDREATLDGMPLSPLRVFGELRQALPRDGIMVLDTGAMCLQAADRLVHDRAPGLVTPLDFGLVGFAYPASLGAAAAAPDRPVVAVAGDGAFSMTLGEIATAVQYDLPVVAVVLDNGAWGAEKAYQKDFFGGRTLGADLVNPPYDQIAKLCGARGYAVTEPGETAAALRDALAARAPAVIHVQVDPDAIFSLRRDLFRKPKEG
jgi:acetolactate synthase-1/2/3 large subunit/sulfoacetaldehyde acetyltransferase